MFNFLGGLVLLLMPLFLIFLFKNRWQGFLFSLTLAGIFNISLALISQALGIFTRPVILISHLIFSGIIIFLVFKKRQKLDFKLNFPLLPGLAFLIIIGQFLSIHYFYSGPVSTINGVESKTNYFQPFPYFSDEWVGAALTEKIIEKSTFFTGNPLTPTSESTHFSNLLTPFFSLLAELFLLLNISPLHGYALLMVLFSTLICWLVYVFLRIMKISRLAASISSLSLPLIANSGNLPGLWSLLPLSGGLIFYLASLSSLALKKYPLFLINSFLTLIIYPPMIIFVFLSGIGYFLGIENKKLKNFFIGVGIFLLVVTLAAASLIIFQQKSLHELFEIVKSAILYNRLDPGKVSYPIWRVIPWATLLFAALGLIQSFKKQSLIFLNLALSGGLLVWLMTSYTDKVLIISPERAIISSAILITILSGFGWEKLFNQSTLFTEKRLMITTGLILIFFGGLSLFYTRLNNWQYFTLQLEDGRQVMPSPPANEYLKSDDQRIFSNIKQTWFIAPPWKGLTIGVTTNNFPLHSKPSFITNYYLSYWEFISASCEKKQDLAKKHRIDYVYSSEFSCPGFTNQDKSLENFYLYKVEKLND